MYNIEKLELWSVLKSKGTNEQRTTVHNLVDHAASLLDRVVETFPTYTIHTSQHAENVISLMAELLGEEVSKLSPLEAAILILSAFYHDVGMVFNNDERNKIKYEQPYWDQFLENHPEALLNVQESNDVPAKIAEWYCRWKHADRVFDHINKMNSQKWSWGVVDIREDFGNVCKSHNENIEYLRQLDTDYLADADLRFCAIVLRLADILDFDRSRSPESVYEYLGLAQQKYSRQEMSNVEWRKHLCSDGFRFPKKREPNYTIKFIAAPEKPEVEYDVRKFLMTIENELTTCAKFITFCSTKWNKFTIPTGIDCTNIKSKGYKYGNFFFTLDQKQVLELLIGEDIYENNDVFIRELLQNAIDTSRHREYYEREVLGKANFDICPINVSQWRDKDRNLWIRIDDYGMGMDLEIIKNYFLKVGSSYYKSPRFKAQLISPEKSTNFKPISRFGIGLLSCFMVSNRVEISTRYYNNSSEPVRLSISGLHGFYTVQTPNLRPKPFPSDSGKKNEYRHKAGTSIAVCIDPQKASGLFSLEKALNKYLLCSPVPVEFENKRIGGDPAEIIERPSLQHKIVELPQEMVSDLESFLKKRYEYINLKGFKITEPIRIELIPMDLTNNSTSDNLKGQVITVHMHQNSDIDLLNKKINSDTYSYINVYCHVSIQNNRIYLEIGYDNNCWSQDITSLLTDNKDRAKAFLSYADKEKWCSHNGIAISNVVKRKPSEDPDNVYYWKISLSTDKSHRYRYTGDTLGVVSLFDRLRPNVSLSRDMIIEFPLNIYSQLNLAYLKSIKGFNSCNLSKSILTSLTSPFQSYTLGQLLNDEVSLIDSEWRYQSIIPTEYGYKSIEEVKELLEDNEQVLLFSDSGEGNLFDERMSFASQVAFVLIHKELNCELILNEVKTKHGIRHRKKLIAKKGQPILSDGDLIFPPLMFISSSSEKFELYFRTLNRNHPVSEWLLKSASILHSDFSNILDEIKKPILLGDREIINTVNNALKELRKYESEIYPPEDLFLSDSDFFSVEL